MNKHERVFGFTEHLKILMRAARSLVFVKRQKKKKLMNKKFKERIMLAVTEVNGCDLCSFVHTKLSLSAGLSIDEIRNILQGNLENVDDNELVAVLYGQHYADSKENPTVESQQKLIDHYGLDKAKVIMGITEIITFTNSMGITMKLLRDRLLFRRDKRSNFINEIFVLLSCFTLFPIFLFLNLFRRSASIKSSLVYNS